MDGLHVMVVFNVKIDIETVKTIIDLEADGLFYCTVTKAEK